MRFVEGRMPEWAGKARGSVLDQDTNFQTLRQKILGGGMKIREQAGLLVHEVEDGKRLGEKAAAALDKVVALCAAPKSITVDNGIELASKAMEHWAYLNGVHLDFIRPGRPVENGYIESFNGRLRDKCLNVEVFFTLADARRKLAIWFDAYNHHRPHSALADRTPAEFAAVCSGENDGDKTALENAARLPHSPRTAAAGRDLTYAPVSSHLQETIT